MMCSNSTLTDLWMLVALIVLGAFSFSCSSLSSDSPMDASSETYAVYSAILNQKYDGKFAIVAERTSPGYFGQTFVGEPIPGLTEDTISDYDEKNKTGETLRSELSKDLHYTLVGTEDAKRLSTEAGWSDLKKKYPEAGTTLPITGGVITFSRVGFNRNLKQALVSVNDSCPALCGSGGFYFLEKENGSWVIKTIQITWQS